MTDRGRPERATSTAVVSGRHGPGAIRDARGRPVVAERPDPQLVSQLRASVAAGRPHRRGRGGGAHRAQEPRATRRSPACPCRTGCTPPRPVRSSTPSSDRAARSRRVRAQVSPLSRRAPCVAANITGTHDVASFVATITLASGVLFLLLAVFKMGWIAQFLSRAVVTGFLFGAAIDVVIGELPKLTGHRRVRRQPDPGASFVDRDARQHEPGDGARRRRVARRRVRPAGARTACPGGIGAGRGRPAGHPALRPGSSHGVALVGTVPRGLPSLVLPNWHLAGEHAEHHRHRRRRRSCSSGSHRPQATPEALRAKHHYRIDINQESLAQGVGERRGWPLRGHARLDEPFRELAERPLRGAHRARLAHDGSHRPADAARARPTVLDSSRRQCSAP